MKLSAIYCSDAELFPRITFFEEGLSVIFARVFDPANLKKDSHNLGKTFLIRVIDFVLMASVDKYHPFRIHADRFDSLVFFGEFLSNNGKYITVRRPVTGRAKVCVNVSDSGEQNYATLPEEQWLHSNLSNVKAENLLDSYFALDAIKPYEYRKGLGYFLRRQSDYDDEFRISRFGRGADLDWKPFTAMLLGFDGDLVKAKYEIDGQLESEKSLLKHTRGAVGKKTADHDEVRGLLQARTTEARALRSKVDAFDFSEVESRFNAEAVRVLEAEISECNRSRYQIDRELVEIARSLAPEYKFDIEAIKQVFAETSTYFPTALLRDYEEVVAFNQSIAKGRRDRLVRLQTELQKKRSDVQARIEVANNERSAALAVLKEQKTLDKYRQLNASLLEMEEQIRVLRSTLEAFDRVEQIALQVEELQKRQIDLGAQVRSMIRTGSETYSMLRATFYELTMRVIGTEAILAVDPNGNNNPEFKTKIVQVGEVAKETSLSDGTSYKKLLCVCFDLAMLITYANKDFYRFVYHDGVFEGLDNRRKASLLDAARAACSDLGLQYVLTVIDADLPRNQDDHKLLFTATEVVRQLDDRGNSGRLFRMDPF